jgi:nicotinic acid mononucleotide adenylyltransferase
LAANIKRYGLDPVLNVPVHGPPLGTKETLARMEEQVAAAQAFCKKNVAAGIYFFGCPVQYNSSGHVR